MPSTAAYPIAVVQTMVPYQAYLPPLPSVHMPLRSCDGDHKMAFQVLPLGLSRLTQPQGAMVPLTIELCDGLGP